MRFKKWKCVRHREFHIPIVSQKIWYLKRDMCGSCICELFALFPWDAEMCVWVRCFHYNRMNGKPHGKHKSCVLMWPLISTAYHAIVVLVSAMDNSTRFPFSPFDSHRCRRSGVVMDSIHWHAESVFMFFLQISISKPEWNYYVYDSHNWFQ